MPNSIKFHERIEVLIRNSAIQDINTLPQILIYFLLQFLFLTTLMQSFFQVSSALSISSNIANSFLTAIVYRPQFQVQNSQYNLIFVIVFTVAITCLNLINIFSGLVLISNFIKNVSYTNLIKLVNKVSFVIILFLNGPMLLISFFQVYQSSSEPENLIVRSLSTINCIFIIGFTYFLEAYSIQIQYKENPSLLKLSNKRYGLFKVLKLLISNFSIFFKDQSVKIYIIMLLIMLLLIYIKQIQNMTKINKYYHSVVQLIYETVTIIQFAIILLMIICTITTLKNILINFDLIFCFLSVIMIITFQNYKHYYCFQYILFGVKQLKTQIQAISYLQQLIQIFKPGKQNYIRTYLVLSHLAQCPNIECFCKTINQNKLQNYLFDGLFLQNFIYASFEVILQKFPRSYNLLFFYYGFKISNNKNILQMFLQMQKIIKTDQTLSERQKYIIYRTQIRIKDKIRKNNLFYKKIDSENVFIQDTIKEHVIFLLESILDTMIFKYKNLAMEIYSLNVIEQQCKIINKDICQIEQNWEKVKQINSYNYQLFDIYLFYYSCIIFSPNQYKKLESQFVGKYQKIRQLKGVNKENLHKYLYSDKSCTIQSNIQQNFGRITNISKSCQYIFGFDQKSMVGRNINDLMPQFFSKEHKKMMNSWLKKQSQKNITSQLIPLIYIDEKKICFSGSTNMKIFTDGQKILFYTMIIRQNQSDHIMLNQFGFIQGIGTRLVSQGVFNMNNVQQQFSKLINNTQYFNVIKKKQNFKDEIIVSVNNTDGDDSSINSSESSRNSDQVLGQNRLYRCMITVTSFKVGDQIFYGIKFDQIKTLNLNKNQANTKSAYNSKKCPKLQKKNKEKADLKLLKMFLDYHFQNNQNRSYQPQGNGKNVISKTQIVNNASLFSTLSNSAKTFNRYILNVKQCLIKPQKVNEKWLAKTSVCIILLSCILYALIYSFKSLFVVGFQSFNAVLFGDGAVSDNNQLLEIIYNNILMSRVYCKEQSEVERCNYLLKNNAFISSVIYNLYESQINVYLTNVTFLSGIKYYESYEVEVDFINGNTTTTVKTIQFMQYFYYAIKKQQYLIESGQGRSKEAQQVMTLLFSNWQNMKFINHNAIYLYYDAGIKELNMLLLYFYLIFVGIIIITLLIALSFKKYYDYQEDKKQIILSIHHRMSYKFLHEEIDKCERLKEKIKNRQFGSRRQKYVEDQSQRIKGQYRYSKNKQHNFYIIFFIGLILSLSVVELLNVSTVVPPCQKMVDLINQLMDSQNYLLENYFELKTYYLEFNYSKTAEQISSQIQSHLQQIEIAFVTYGKQSINMFSFDPTFEQDFNNLLIKNSCEITAWVFESWQIDYCYNNFHYNILSKGVASGMQYLQRNTEAALVQLLQKQKTNINHTEYFKQDIFQDIDDSIFYMFRLYQATQARMYQGLNYSININVPILNGINYFILIFMVFVILLWLCSLRGQQKKLSNLYGVILQLPESIMKRKNISPIIEQNLHISY